MLCEACSLPSRVLQYSCGDRPQTRKMITHSTGWSRLEKTVTEQMGEVTGGPVGEEDVVEDRTRP